MWEVLVEAAEILERLTPLFRKVFEDPGLTPTPSMRAEQVPLWDSLNHVSLVMEVERAFGIKFALGELQDLRNVGALVKLIQAKEGRRS